MVDSTDDLVVDPQGTRSGGSGRDEWTRAGRLLDELAARATPSPTDRDFDGWHAKVAPDLPFRRCNSVLPPSSAIGGGGGTAEVVAIVEAIEDWYAGLGQRVIVIVSSADPGADRLDGYLAARGYGYEAPVHVMTRTIGAIAGGDRRPVAPPPLSAPPLIPSSAVAGEPCDGAEVMLEIAVSHGIDEVWAQRYGAAHGGVGAARKRTESYGRMLAVLGRDALGASASMEGEAAGVGFGVVDRGHVGIFGMGTAPRFRRRGVASAVVGTLLAAAAERGATRAYLQVETDNVVAIELYRRLGFIRSHGYHYRVSSPLSG